MATRSSHAQSCHDTAVKRSAAQYLSWEYAVKADVSGFSRPENLEVDGKKRRPDIIAKNNKKIVIVEWETPESMKKDKDQHKHLRTYARRIPGAEFHIRECKVN